MTEPSFGPEAWGPLARAWRAYLDGDEEAVLVVHADDGEAETMPVSIFFRGRKDLRRTDEAALSEVRGRVLDGGAGVGSLSLILQEDGIPVTALEVIPEGVTIMRERGVRDVRAGRLEDLADEVGYDTILLLMNGTALAGTLGAFPTFLATLEALLARGGQVLIDSTSLLDGENGVGTGGDPYPGEIQYQMEFRGVKGTPFPQLFLDPGTLGRTARECGWFSEVVWEGEGGEFLARLTRVGTE